MAVSAQGVRRRAVQPTVSFRRAGATLPKEYFEVEVELTKLDQDGDLGLAA
jgi:hypothetical protein